MPGSHDALIVLCFAAAAGVILVVASERLNIPSIVLLLFGGIALGPSGLGWVNPASLGEGLELVISLAVAVILFEGGLTLDIPGYRRTSRVIKRMVTVGPLVTWLGTAVVVSLLFDTGPGMALVAGALIIVTGPTVIAPLLRRVHVKERLHHILYWESVLIDPLGVFVAVLCYEWLSPGETLGVFGPVGRFGLRLFVGLGIGTALGLITAAMLRRSWVADEHVNIFVLGSALLTFGTANALLTESGILAVVAAGLVVGLRHPPQLRHVKRFKLELTEFGIGLAFVLLAARLDLARFVGWELLVLLGVVILFLRPTAIWLATWGEGFELREKSFLAWIGPRGIVAAAMASLFAIRLEDRGFVQAVHLETITYAVIATTVTLQGLSAPWVARLLGLERTDRRKWILMGHAAVAEELARGLRRAGVSVAQLTSDEATLDVEGLVDPRFADAQALLFVHAPSPQFVSGVQRSTGLGPEQCFHWDTSGLEEEPDIEDGGPAPGSAVWTQTGSVEEVAHGLATDALVVDLVEIGDADERGHFGPDFQPLFWVRGGRAEIVPDPLQPNAPRGEFAVVLRRRIPGLADLIAHVDVIADPVPSFEAVVDELMQSAKRVQPALPAEALTAGILERHRTMSVAMGSGIAIPHGYSEGLERSLCFVASVVEGVTMPTPDDRPIHLVFLVLSPSGRARAHLDSLAALAKLSQDQEFLALMARQRVPERLARLIGERG